MKKFVVFLTLMLIGWTLIGKMDKKRWDNLAIMEKKAIVCLITDKYFEATNCGGAEIRVMDDDDNVQFFAQCLCPRIKI